MTSDQEWHALGEADRRNETSVRRNNTMAAIAAPLMYVGSFGQILTAFVWFSVYKQAADDALIVACMSGVCEAFLLAAAILSVILAFRRNHGRDIPYAIISFLGFILLFHPFLSVVRA